MSIKEYKIKRLVEKIRDGSSSAFAEFYGLHYRSVYSFCYKFLKSKELAQDCAQLTFIKIWELRGQLNPDANLKSYLFTICKNAVLKSIEKAARERTLKEKVLSEYMAERNREAAPVEEWENLAVRAYEQLPPQRQLVFKLCKVEGHSYEQVAMQLGISQGTVRDHLFKASKSIRRYLTFNRLLVIGTLMTAIQ